MVYCWYESLMKLLLLFSLLIQIALATLLSHVKIIMIYWHNLVLQIKITTCVYTYYVSYQLADIYSIIRTPMLHPWMKVTVTFELPFFIIACCYFAKWLPLFSSLPQHAHMHDLSLSQLGLLLFTCSVLHSPHTHLFINHREQHSSRIWEASSNIPLSPHSCSI